MARRAAWSLGVLGILLIAAFATRGSWWPTLETAWNGAPEAPADPHAGHDHGDHEGHDHGDHEGHEGHAGDNDHEGHDDAHALELSQVAWKNIGLRTGTVETGTFVKTVSVPAIVVERPGRSQVRITAPMTGVVTRVYRIEGEAVDPGSPLFDLRLTHEDLVTAQRDFLAAAQELDVVEREIKRLEAIGEGVVAGRRVVEQQYEKDKVEARMLAQRQGLLLHGLTEEQIDEIVETRHLIQQLTVRAPPFPEIGEHLEIEHLFHVQRVNVHPGEHVDAGAALATLADHCLLYVEGQAFEDDAPRLVRAAREGWNVQVTPAGPGEPNEEPLQLEVQYVADHIDPESRALRFYLQLPNNRVRDETEQGHRFVAWQYRPGQRMQVKVPVGEPWQDQIILPAEAVVEEGAETFVFQQNGDHFDRLPVHVLYRDRDTVVIDKDPKLLGTTLAMSGAYRMHLAIKNRSGGGVDPHAGHNH